MPAATYLCTISCVASHRHGAPDCGPCPPIVTFPPPRKKLIAIKSAEGTYPVESNPAPGFGSGHRVRRVAVVAAGRRTSGGPSVQVIDRRKALSIAPIWRLAFRPFFLAGSVYALLAIPLWWRSGPAIGRASSPPAAGWPGTATRCCSASPWPSSPVFCSPPCRRGPGRSRRPAIA